MVKVRVAAFRKNFIIAVVTLPYFFGYKTEFFSFQNNPKDLDPSCKMDLDLWDCLGRVKLVLLLGSIPGLATYFRFSFRFFKKGSCQLLAKVCA